MPKEYEKQRDAMIADGKSEKEAKKWAAINYWKKHHKSVNSVDKKHISEHHRKMGRSRKNHG